MTVTPFGSFSIAPRLDEGVSREAMSQWGQVMPAAFTKPKLSARSLLEIPKHVYRSPDLSLGKLRTLAKIFG